MALESAPQEWRINFASIALRQLAQGYLAEVELARRDPQAGSDKQARWNKQVRWPEAVESYAEQLLFLQIEAETAGGVAFSVSPLMEVTVTVAGRAIMLTHPRPEQQNLYEQQVLEEFCQWHDCSFSVTSEPAVISAGTLKSTSPVTEPEWRFAEQGFTCRHEGLQIVFPVVADSGAMRTFCVTLFGEVRTLQQGLLSQRRYGVMIDCSRLKLQAVPGSDQQMLQLNAEGDTLLLNLPLLSRSAVLLSKFCPWLQLRLSGQPATLTLQAAEAGWL